ncbi:hypothetical protein [uncultured Psychroserpens sp.]|nr:hypothetical protein [uncultured Psychroserpens sp.]
MDHSDKKNNNYVIDSLGSLGLLAFGDIGLREWRKFKNKNNAAKKIDEEE